MSYLQEQSHIFGIYYNHWGSVWGSKQVWFGIEGGDQHFVLEQCFHEKKDYSLQNTTLYFNNNCSKWPQCSGLG